MTTNLPRGVRAMTCTRSSIGAVTYHLCPDPDEALAGWALATVNDATGELAIQSDWGNWNYIWGTNPSNLGVPTLTHFIALRSDCGYLADKLSTREERHEFDADASVKALQKRVCQMRLEDGREPRRRTAWCAILHKKEVYPDGLDEIAARRIFDEIGELASERERERFMEMFCRISGYDMISHEPWYDDELFIDRPSHRYLQLLHGILPALVKACRERVSRIDTV